ncbi:MAG: hypothetical protein JSS30_02485 [Verrucomicrobia bacterium]|nr:hypothetical protein [Verrucomicrobiota bacterium]
MKVVILNKDVRRNIELFRQLVHRQGQKREQLLKSIKKGYKAFINRKTGQLRFPGLKEGNFSSDEWKAVVIELHPTKEGAFDVVSADGDQVFDLSQIKSVAYELFAKTIKTLNEITYHPKHADDALFILRQFANIDFVLSDQEEGVRNLVHDAWYNVDRIEAEELLSGKVFGTYLFRKDQYAQDLEDSLNENGSAPATCITLTYTDKDDKISEKTLVYKEGKWLFYDDDPTLSGHGYDSVKELIDKKAKMLQQPLLV